jgi:hypothetical protein
MGQHASYAEPDDTKECAMLPVAHCAASKAVLVPQPFLSIHERLSFDSLKASLVFEPPDLGVSEELGQLINVSFLKTA